MASPANKLSVRGDADITTLTSNAIVYSNNGVLTNTNPSSLEYKAGINPIDLKASRVLSLQPKSFVWKRTGYADVGCIAEDVNALLPEIYREQGITKGYDLWKLVFYEIDLLKDSQKRIDAQKQTIAKQQQALAGQDSEISALTVLYCRAHPKDGVCRA